MNQVSQIFPALEVAPCRVCGATQAAPDAQAFERVCDVCWRKFKYQLGKAPVTRLAFDRWLGRELFLAVQRLNRNGILGRCEAISARAQKYQDGYKCGHQCARPASTTIDGRLLCGQHAISPNLILIGELLKSPYDTLAELMGDLAQRDDRFRQCLKTALAAKEHT